MEENKVKLSNKRYLYYLFVPIMGLSINIFDFSEDGAADLCFNCILTILMLSNVPMVWYISEYFKRNDKNFNDVKIPLYLFFANCLIFFTTSIIEDFTNMVTVSNSFFAYAIIFFACYCVTAYRSFDRR